MRHTNHERISSNMFVAPAGRAEPRRGSMNQKELAEEIKRCAVEYGRCCRLDGLHNAGWPQMTTHDAFTQMVKALAVLAGESK